jgi:hypothetical protein
LTTLSRVDRYEGRVFLGVLSPGSGASRSNPNAQKSSSQESSQTQASWQKGGGKESTLPIPGSVGLTTLKEILDWIAVASDLVLDSVHQSNLTLNAGLPPSQATTTSSHPTTKTDPPSQTPRSGSESKPKPKTGQSSSSSSSKLWCFEMIGLMERNGFFERGTLESLKGRVPS